jgi:hypothetical protein
VNKCPKIGDRVAYRGSGSVGPCVGVVTAIYKTYEWDSERERDGPVRPESEWHVGMKPDTLPDVWCYTSSDRFAPCVATLKRAP